MAYLLAERGYHLILVARRTDLLQELAAELPHGATVIGLDLGRPGAASELYQQCREKELTIDVLINNAGFGRLEPHTEINPDTLESMNHLNVTCPASLCRLFGEEMKGRGEGCILNVGSIGSYLPVPFMANYAAGKAFISSFTRALRAELRPYGVQVSLLNPGPTDTEFGERAQSKGNFLKRSPGLMTAREVAEIGIQGLFADHAEILPGALNQALPLLTRLIPKSFLIRVAAGWLHSRLDEN